MNPNAVLIERYEHNKSALKKAIIDAGGSEYVVDTPSFREVLIALSCNDILITADYTHAPEPTP